MRLSRPSTLKVFAPRYFRWRKASKRLAWSRLRKTRLRTSGAGLGHGASIRERSHPLSSGSTWATSNPTGPR